MPSRRSAMANSIAPASEVSRPQSKSAGDLPPRTAGNANGGIVSWVMAGVAGATMRESLVSTPKYTQHQRLRPCPQPPVHRSMNKTG